MVLALLWCKHTKSIQQHCIISQQNFLCINLLTNSSYFCAPGLDPWDQGVCYPKWAPTRPVCRRQQQGRLRARRRRGRQQERCGGYGGYRSNRRRGGQGHPSDTSYCGAGKEGSRDLAWNGRDTRVMFRCKYNFSGYWDFLMVMRNSFSGMKIKHGMTDMQSICPPSVMKIKR